MQLIEIQAKHFFSLVFISVFLLPFWQEKVWNFKQKCLMVIWN